MRRIFIKRGLEENVDFTYEDLTTMDNPPQFEGGTELPVIVWGPNATTYGLKVDDVHERIDTYLATTVQAAA